MYMKIIDCIKLFLNIFLYVNFQLKQFIKQCKVSNYTKQMKQIVEKVEATCKVITQRRKTATFNLADAKGVVGTHVYVLNCREW